MKKKEFLMKIKRCSRLSRKAKKIHDKLFLHVNRDIFLRDSQVEKLFIELDNLNLEISKNKKEVQEIKMYL